MGNPVDAVKVGRHALGVENLRPLDTEVGSGLERILALVPHGNAQHLELVAAVLLPHLADDGNLAAAGTAPRSPEIDQHVFALAHVVGKARGRRIGIAVLDGEVGERHSLGGLLQRIVLVDDGFHGSELTHTVARKGQRGVELLGRLQIGAPTQESIGAQRVVVGFDQRTGQVAERNGRLCHQRISLGLELRFRKQRVAFKGHEILVKRPADGIVLRVKTI